MKTRLIIPTLCFLLTFTACKKELIVDVQKTYIEEGATGSGLGFGGMILTLMPDGKADLLYAGDIMDRGTYTTKGNNVRFKSATQDLTFKVISDTKLRYEQKVLKLDQK